MRCLVEKKLFRTPLGWVGVAASELGVVRVALPGKSRKAIERELASALDARAMKAGADGFVKEGCRSAQILKKCVQLLKRYFSGEAAPYDLPLDFGSYTPFQQAVWRAAAEIPFGKTQSYGRIAKRIGKPLASRAVGQAMGANPVPILVP